MVSNDFDGKATHLNCFYMNIRFEPKYAKPAKVSWEKTLQHTSILKYNEIPLENPHENLSS